MNVIILSPYPEKICETIKKAGDSYIVLNSELNLDILNRNKINFIVSYGYSKIIKKDIIEAFKDSIINLHISFLPFNKGAHPNLWSHIEKTKTGVTIHKIDEGIDTGEIIFRKEVFIDTQKHTFSTSYNLLKTEIEILFEKNWRKIKSNNYKVIPNKDKGTYHKKGDGLALLSRLKFNWDSNISDVISSLENENTIS